MLRALDEHVIDGIETSIPLHVAVMNELAIIDGDYDICWLEEFIANSDDDKK